MRANARRRFRRRLPLDSVVDSVGVAAADVAGVADDCGAVDAADAADDLGEAAVRARRKTANRVADRAERRAADKTAADCRSWAGPASADRWLRRHRQTRRR